MIIISDSGRDIGKTIQTLMESAGAVKLLHGDAWPERSERLQEFVREAMRRLKTTSPLSGAIAMAKNANADGNPMAAIEILAAALEMDEKKGGRES
jgi:hypothetical protein